MQILKKSTLQKIPRTQGDYQRSYRAQRLFSYWCWARLSEFQTMGKLKYMLQIIPTDTCYGLAWELNQQDFLEIYRLKWRDFRKQLAILVRDYDDMDEFIEISNEQKKFLHDYPFPWSFLGKKNKNFILPDFMNDIEYAKIALRVAENCIPANIRDSVKYPLFLTSANISWNPESKTLAEAREYFLWILWYNGGVCEWLPSDIFSLDPRGKIIYLRKNYGV